MKAIYKRTDVSRRVLWKGQIASKPGPKGVECNEGDGTHFAHDK